MKIICHNSVRRHHQWENTTAAKNLKIFFSSYFGDEQNSGLGFISKLHS